MINIIEEIVWYKTEQECKKGHKLNYQVSESEIQSLHEQKPMIPLEHFTFYDQRTENE